MKYRSEIDGLRALAVIPVILFHAGVPLFSGGFVGVDIFFVISGYLITTIIIQDLVAGKFSIVSFYERRARRILPALLLVVIVCAVATWFFLRPLDGEKFAKSILGVITFTSNIMFWLDGGYFESASELKPLLHTWSLAVEEQYYLFFPLLLMLVYRYAWKYLVALLIVLALLSFLLMEWAVMLSAASPAIVSAGFFLLPTRCWELLIGSLVAFHLSQGKTELPLATRNILSAAGGAMILWATFSFDKHTPFPSHATLLPTLGTALIILYATTDTLSKAVLSTRIPVAIGLVSYSAYLWHQPVFAFYRYQTATTDIRPVALLVLFVLIIILAAFTWKYIEQPFRNKSSFGRRAIFRYGLIASLIAGMLAYVQLTATSNFERQLAKSLSENPFVYFGNMDERQFTLNRLSFDNNNPAALLMGSSRLMQAGSNVVGQEALNLSVSGASIEDIVSILSEATARYPVDNIYIGADPWLFNDDSGQDRWQTIGDKYYQWVTVLKGGAEATMLAPRTDYTIDGSISARIQALYYATNLQNLVAPDGTPGNQNKRSIDGVIVYTTEYMDKSQAEIETGFDALLKYSMEPYTHSEDRRVLFEQLLQSFEGYKVHIVLSPYHPVFFSQMMAENAIFYEMESYFRSLANQQGIAILGSYDPVRVGCSADDFYDGMHPNERCMRKVFHSGARNTHVGFQNLLDQW